MGYTTRCAERYGIHVTLHRVRLVWAAVTRRPQATARELSAELGIPYNTVSAALRLLKDAGYIDFEPYSGRARTVLIPFIVTGKKTTIRGKYADIGLDSEAFITGKESE